MHLSRRPAPGAGFCLSLVLASLLVLGCPSKDKNGKPTPTEGGEATPEGAATGEASATGTPLKIEAGELQPVIQAQGAEGVVPDRIVIELARRVVGDETVGSSISKETSAQIEPALKGHWEFTSGSTLTFVPDEPLQPGTEYKVTLASVETTAGQVSAPSAGAWSKSFKTPAFTFVRMSPATIDLRKKQVEMDMVFSAPVRVKDVKKFSTWRIDGATVADASYSFGDKRHIVRVRMHAGSLKPNSQVVLDLRSGVPAQNDRSLKAARANPSVRIAAGDPIKIQAAYRGEGPNGHYIEVVCDDTSVGDKRDYYDRINYDWYWVSRRCMLEDADAAEGIHFDPPVKFRISTGGGGFRIMGDFKRGTYAMRIDAGVRSIDGGVLHSTFERSFSIPARSPKIDFAAQGRYLPRKAWKNLSVSHLNVGEAELVVRQVRPENLVFWMSNDDNERADERTSDIVLRKKLKFESKPDEMQTTLVPVGDYLDATTKGLVELTLSAPGASSTARLLLTDMNVIAKGDRGAAGRVYVWAIDMDSLAPRGGVDVRLVRKSGTVVSECTTRGDKGCVLTYEKDEVDPSPPFAILATKGDDLTYLKFADLKTEVADARIHGDAYKSERLYRAAIYSDRGVYRPGETARLVGILRTRDNAAPQAGMPVEIRVIDPREKTIKKITRSTNEAGVVDLDMPFAAFAATGSYQMVMRVADKKVGDYTFQVEEFVPERMKVTAKAAQPGYLVTDDVEINVEARYLFGGTPEGHEFQLTCRMEPSVFAPRENANYQYGVWYPSDEEPKSLALGEVAAVLDDNGKGSLACPPLEAAGGYHTAARVMAQAAVFEAGSGRTTVGRASVPVHPEKYYLGLQTGTKKAQAGKPVTAEGVVVDWDGKLAPNAVQEVKVEYVRLEAEYDWYWDEEEDGSSYQRHMRPVVEGRETVPVKGGKFTARWSPQTDAEAFLVRAHAGEAQTDLQIEGEGSRYWWSPATSAVDQTPKPAKPTWIALGAPKSIEVGKKAEVSFTAPFDGRALLTVETDEILTSEWMSVKAGDQKWSFAVKDFAPNVYVTAFVVKDPHLDSAEAFMPDRAFGVQSIAVTPTAFTHEVTIEAPSEVRSNSTLAIKLNVGPVEGKTYATVAVVDEGILSLTQFTSPKPNEQLFRRRALGIDTYETVGWSLLLPPGGPSSATGGGEDGEAPGRVQPVKPVALWSGVREVPKNGVLDLKFDIPEYRGKVRVMAVTAGPKRTGHAVKQVTVADPLVVQATLPRFITKGDQIQIPVFLTNLSGADQKVSVVLGSENLAVPGLEESIGGSPLKIVGKSEKSVAIKNGGSGIVVFQAQADRAIGAATVRVIAKAGKLESQAKADVPFLPAGPKSRKVQQIELTSGTLNVKPYLAGWVPTSEQSTFWVTSNPYGEAFDHLKYLVHYPYGCIEQTTSSTRPLVFVGDLLHNVDPSLVADAKIEDMVMHGVNRVFSMQTPEGGFAYWPGGTEPTYWGTAYATHMLLDAQKAGFPVSQDRLNDALDWIEGELTNKFEAGVNPSGYSYYWKGSEPYLQFVLAVAGRGRKARLQRLIQQMPADAHGEDAEHLYMLQAALYMSGDHRYEKQLRKPDVSALTAQRRNSWTFYSDRRRRGFVLSTYTDLFGADEGGEKLANLVAEGLKAHQSSWYTTQELVWSVTGLGKRVQKGAKEFDATLVANGKKVEPAGAKREQNKDKSWAIARASEYKSMKVDVKAKGKGKLFLIVGSEGVRQNADYRVGGDGLSIKRRYRTLDGDYINPTSGDVALGDMIFTELSLTNTTGERISNVALVDRFPAGWEIENPRLGRGGSVEWVDSDDVWDADYMNVRDDRLEMFGSLAQGKTVKIVYALRAVTAGTFTIPPVEAEAMYDPRIWARQAGGRAKIEGPWEGYLY